MAQAPGRLLDQARGAAVPVGLLVVAELAYLFSNTHSDALAPPHEIFRAFVVSLFDGTLLIATAQTLAATVAGLSFGFTAGVLAGAVLGILPLLDKLLFVSIEIVRALPAIAFIPIAMLIFGFGYKLEISIVAFATFWPTLLLTRAAVANIEPRLLEVSRALGFSLPAFIWKIVLPAALPRVLVALRLAIGVALIVAVTVEVAANPLGLGYGLMSAQQALQPATMLALLCWVGVVGWALNHLLLLIQTKLFRRIAPTDAVMS